MTPTTEDVVRALREADWFARVGEHDSEVPEFVSSWKAALAGIADRAWDDLIHEAPNQYRERLAERDPERFARWNEVVREIRPTALALVEEKVADTVARNRLPKKFVDHVNWDIVHLLMESEYSDVYPPGFFGAQGYWYFHGHFPCGWRGKFPQGKPIVF